MKYRYLGSSGLQVSEIIYGTWLTDQKRDGRSQVKSCVGAALELGITTFDTADIYGRGVAEEILGDALKDVPRDSIEVCTKVWGRMGSSPNQAGLSRKHVKEACDASLRRLSTDYIDLYQAHRFDPHTPLEETFSAFADLVHQGKVHYIGVSEWSARQLAAGSEVAKDFGLSIVSNQPQYSMLWRVIEPEVLPTSRNLSISQLAYSPLAQGLLTGKYRPGKDFPAGSRAASEHGKSWRKRYGSARLLDAIGELDTLARSMGVTLGQLSIAWVLAQAGLSAAIVGASRPDQLTENVRSVDVELDADVLDRIDTTLGELVERDPAKTARPDDVMPEWRADQDVN